MLSERRDPRPLAITAVLLATAVWLVTAWTSEARAAPPANDARATAQDLGRLPADVRGTTVDAAVDPDEPGTCSATKNSVWYGFTPGIDREVLVALDAAGDLDASIDVYVRQRSQTTPVVCGRTNRRGEATLELDAAAGTSYLIRIAALANSVTDAFRLRVVAPDRPAQPPGQRLAVGGVAADVERLADPDDSWAVRLKAGRTYRVNLVTRGTGCAVLELYPADIGDFSEQSALRTLRCDAHTVFTAPASGRYSLLVRAPRASRALLHYRLRVGRAKSDDTAPGHALANDVRKHGTLQGQRAGRGRPLPLLGRASQRSGAPAGHGTEIQRAAADRRRASARVRVWRSR